MMMDLNLKSRMIHGPLWLGSFKKAHVRDLASSDSPSQKVLALDLDETLIHCKGKPFDNVTAVGELAIGPKKTDLYVSERPGLKAFIVNMSKIYKIVLYTSSVKEYALKVLEIAGIRQYFTEVIHREHCQLNNEGKLEKNLAILGEDVEQVILVDDSVVHVRNQPNNILLVKPYTGDSEDCELFYLAQFLEGLANEKDVRPVMERFKRFQRETKKSTIQRMYIVHRYFNVKSLTSLKARYEPEFRSSEKGVDPRLDDIETNLDEIEIEKRQSQTPFRRKTPLKKLGLMFNRHFTDQTITTADSLNESTFQDDPVEEWEEELTPEDPIVDKLPPMNLKPQSLSLKRHYALA